MNPTAATNEYGAAPRFVRRTVLRENEYRKNFHQLDADVVAAVTSAEADRVTPLMGKIYLRLVNAPERFWERRGVLRIEAELREEKSVKAWAVLCELVGVSSATASKAVRWMHEQGIIGYFSARNGVGLRIFLNRAASSIGVRPPHGGQKILAFPPASFPAETASTIEPAFNVPFGVLESSDTDMKSGAPKNGADEGPADERLFRPTGPAPAALSRVAPNASSGAPPARAAELVPLGDVISRLRAELEPAMQAAARRAAAREHERTREWLESRGLPKAARVAQQEAFNVLRKYGVVNESPRAARSSAAVGRNACATTDPRLLSADEINDLAQACVAVQEAQGRSVDVTLAEMSVGVGGFLLAEDVPRVRERVKLLLDSGGGREGK